MIAVTASVDAAEAFAVVADFSRNTQWQQGMQSCVFTSDPPLGLGSTCDQEAPFLGRKILTSFEVPAPPTESDPNTADRVGKPTG